MATAIAQYATAPDGADDGKASLATLVAEIVHGYLFTPAEVQQLGERITAARVAVYEVMYRQGAKNVGADVPTDWQLSDAAHAAQAKAAQQSAESVAATYQDDITHAATTYAQQWLDDHQPDGQDEGERDDDQDRRKREAAAALILFLHGWTANRADWKSDQVARHETNDAAAAGARSLMADLFGGDLTDADGNPLDLAQLALIVLPETAAEMFCAEYAGNVYPVEAWDDIDLFPAHVGCPHEVTPFILTDGDVETEW